MADIEFAWSTRKAAANKRKHRVSFDEAQTVFYDEEALLLEDPDHWEDEDRFLLLGLSSNLRVLVVVHSYTDDETIRIISARKANSRERLMYEKRRRQ